jgi:hypothetical protein
MIGLRRIRGQIEAGKDRAEKQPRAELPRHQIGMLSLPAESGGGGERLFHHRCGVDKNFHVAAGAIDEPASDLFQTGFDQVVVIVAARIDRNGAAAWLLENGKRIAIRSVIDAEHQDGAHLRPQHLRVAAPIGVGRHPRHIAVSASLEKVPQPRRGLRDGVGPNHAGGVKAARPRRRNQFRLERGVI